MEGVYKTVVRLPYQSELPEDLAVNDFYFLGTNAGSDLATDVTSLTTRLLAFYNNIPTGQTKQISDYIGDQVLRTVNACSFSYYFSPDIAPPPTQWGSPDAVVNWTIGPDDNVGVLPAEVAIVASFHGDLTDIPETAANPTPPPAIIRPASRRRGRIYLGPLNTAAGAQGGPNNDLLLSTVSAVVVAAMADLEADNDDLQWVVYSPTGGELHQVVGGYVDNAFDTQRRRGSAATARFSWGT